MSNPSCQKDSCPPPPRPAFFQCPPLATVCPSRPGVSNAVCPSRQQVSVRRCPTWGIEAAAAQDKEVCRRNKLKGELLPFPGIEHLSLEFIWISKKWLLSIFVCVCLSLFLLVKAYSFSLSLSLSFLVISFSLSLFLSLSVSESISLSIFLSLFINFYIISIDVSILGKGIWFFTIICFLEWSQNAKQKFRFRNESLNILSFDVSILRKGM